MADRPGLHADVNDPRVGHEATARVLLDKGADVAHADNKGGTALIFASLNGHAGERRARSPDSDTCPGISDPPRSISGQKGGIAASVDR